MSRNDNGSALQRLLKYPPVESIEPIISLSWKCKDDYLVIREKKKCEDELKSNEIKSNPEQEKIEKLLFTSALKEKETFVKPDLEEMETKSEPSTHQNIQKKKHELKKENHIESTPKQNLQSLLMESLKELKQSFFSSKIRLENNGTISNVISKLEDSMKIVNSL